MRLAALTLALSSIICASPTLAQVSADNAGSIPIKIFADFCLESRGDNQSLVKKLREMKAASPTLLAEMSSKDRIRLFGKDRVVGWIFAPIGKNRPVALSASSTGMCEVRFYGLVNDYKAPFEAKFIEYATGGAGQFYYSGDASFLKDPSLSGHAYTLEMPKETAYIMLIESSEETGIEARQIQVIANVKPKK